MTYIKRRLLCLNAFLPNDVSQLLTTAVHYVILAIIAQA